LIRRLVPRPIRRFFRIAYQSNLTGLSSMVAYNMILGVIPLAFVALFASGRVLASTSVQARVIVDLREVFPGTADHTLESLLRQVQQRSTSTGILAIATSLWRGSSLWSALDTAFSRIYGGEPRSWLRQKRFALSMVGVVLLFMLATVSVPTLQAILNSGVHALPFDLSHVTIVVYAATLAFGLVLLFICLTIIYFRVPHFRVPWRAVWPGALGATLAIGIVDYGFPEYLSHISTIARFSSSIVFIVILLGWFYVIAIIILGGAVVNALRMRPPGPED
jgi:YihY family inner membrane protein